MEQENVLFHISTILTHSCKAYIHEKLFRMHLIRFSGIVDMYFMSVRKHAIKDMGMFTIHIFKNEGTSCKEMIGFLYWETFIRTFIVEHEN